MVRFVRHHDLINFFVLCAGIQDSLKPLSPLSLNPALASKAAEFVEKCDTEPSPLVPDRIKVAGFDKVGENVGWGSLNKQAFNPMARGPTYVSNLWASQRKVYM